MKWCGYLWRTCIGNLVSPNKICVASNRFHVPCAKVCVICMFTFLIHLYSLINQICMMLECGREKKRELWISFFKKINKYDAGWVSLIFKKLGLLWSLGWMYGHVNHATVCLWKIMTYDSCITLATWYKPEDEGFCFFFLFLFFSQKFTSSGITLSNLVWGISTEPMQW